MSKAGKGVASGFTPAQQGRFLRVLGETGNVSEAARASGVKRGTPYNLRRRDEWFARDWDSALATAPERIAGRAPPALQTVRRSAGGRTQLAAMRANQWTARDDDAFFARLEATGNVRASARAIGRDPNSAWRRRRECPDFARRFDAALADAGARLEYGLIEHANNLIDRAWPQAQAPIAEGGDPIPPIDPSFALQVVKWLDGRKAGRSRGARSHKPKEPGIAEVKADILRKIEAIERHRGREKGGDGGVGETR